MDITSPDKLITHNGAVQFGVVATLWYFIWEVHESNRGRFDVYADIFHYFPQSLANSRTVSDYCLTFSALQPLPLKQRR